jgi:hypothetical protein
MYGKFYSVLKANLPSSGTVGDTYYATDTREIFLVIGDNSLVELLQAIPIPVKGDKGDTGAQGPAGESFAEHFPDFHQIGGVLATVEYAQGNGGDTGFIVTGIENGIGESFERR